MIIFSAWPAPGSPATSSTAPPSRRSTRNPAGWWKAGRTASPPTRPSADARRVHASYLHLHWAGHPQVAQNFCDAVHRYAAEDDRSPGTQDLDHHGDAELADGLVDLAVNVRVPAPPEWLAEVINASTPDLAAYPRPEAARAAIAAAHDYRWTRCCPPPEQRRRSRCWRGPGAGNVPPWSTPSSPSPRRPCAQRATTRSGCSLIIGTDSGSRSVSSPTRRSGDHRQPDESDQRAASGGRPAPAGSGRAGALRRRSVHGRRSRRVRIPGRVGRSRAWLSCAR